MVESFFPSYQTGALDPIVLISGPPSCGKTSLLFQFAFNCCSSKSARVVFICNKRKIESNPPFLAQGVNPSSEVFRRVHMKYGVNPSSEVFRRVHMKYIDDYEGIKKYFAAFHLQDSFPSAVIIDDFGDFFDDRSCQLRYGNSRGRDLAVSRTLAICHETIKQSNLQPEGNCKLLLSDTYQGDGPRLLFLYNRWIPCIFIVTEGDGPGSFTLKMSSSSRRSSGGTPEVHRSAKYSIALQYLVLEGFINK